MTISQDLGLVLHVTMREDIRGRYNAFFTALTTVEKRKLLAHGNGIKKSGSGRLHIIPYGKQTEINQIRTIPYTISENISNTVYTKAAKLFITIRTIGTDIKLTEENPD